MMEIFTYARLKQLFLLSEKEIKKNESLTFSLKKKKRKKSSYLEH